MVTVQTLNTLAEGPAVLGDAAAHRGLGLRRLTACTSYKYHVEAREAPGGVPLLWPEQELTEHAGGGGLWAS